MLESELNALREQELNNTIKRRRLSRNELIRTAVFSERYACRVKAVETYFATCFYKFDMAQFISTLQSHSLCSDHSLRSNLGLNASRESRPATEHRKTNRPRRKWQTTQNKKIQKEKKLRVQNWTKRRERLDELSALNSKVLKALDIKECILKMQSILLEKLAVEENRLKKLAEISSSPMTNFDDRVQELEEVIRFMQYWVSRSSFELENVKWEEQNFSCDDNHLEWMGQILAQDVARSWELHRFTRTNLFESSVWSDEVESLNVLLHSR